MRYKIFLDASCLIAALGSNSGGSSRLIYLVSQTKHTMLTSEIAIDEAKRHLKNVDSSNRKLFLLVSRHNIKVTGAPSLSQVEKCYKYTPDKDDAHLIASCFTYGCSFLVSLDKRHVLAITKKIRKPRIMSPGELVKFLQK